MDLKQFFNKITLLKCVVYLLLLGQLGSSTIAHYHLLFDSKSELIELTNSEDNESEEDKKEEKKDEIRLDFYTASYNDLIARCITFRAKYFLSLHHPEVSVPPPKHFLT